MAVVLAVAIGAALAVVAEVVLIAVFHPARTGGSPIDVTKLAFTVVGGVGGVVALVIAYRRQRDLEQNRFVERFGAAAAQRGAADVAVRIAGVYAMAGVADEADGLRRQQCIDVLCGYLRLPYDAAHGSSGRTKRVVTVPNPRVNDVDDPGKVEEHHEYRNNDCEVRATIVRVIAAHLRPEAEYSWSENDFDFRTAYLEDADFHRATFAGITSFDRALFTDTAWFDGATFTDARFNKTTFTDAWFDRATFTGTAWFGGATFAGTVSFNAAAFVGICTFEKADFGVQRISFADPKRWGPPEPAFDWSMDITLKPVNVEPQDWPPTAVASSPN